MNSALLRRIEQLEAAIKPLSEMQILRVVLPIPGERIVGMEAAAELGLPALDREPGESTTEFEHRWSALVRWPEGINRGIVVLRGAQ